MAGIGSELEFDSPKPPRRERPILVAGLVLLGLAVVWTLGLGSFLINPRVLPVPERPGPDVFPGSLEAQQAEALAVWRRFVEAEDFGDRVAEVKDAARVEPLMRDYYQRRGHPFPTMSKVSVGKPGGTAARRVMIFAVEPFSGPGYGVSLEWDGRRYVVDWESLVAYGTMDWYELTETRPTEGQKMRVFLSPLKKGWHRPGLPEGAKSYVMSDREAPDPVTVVARRQVAAAIEAATSGQRRPLRLMLQWSDELGALEIVRFIGPYWSD